TLFWVTETDNTWVTVFCRFVCRFDFWMVCIVTRHFFVCFLLCTDFI
ncbi:hypothetical protein D043_3322B, partial [Vibrio parahaemolyticus EKP-021]